MNSLERSIFFSVDNPVTEVEEEFAPSDIEGLSLWLDASSGDLINTSDAAISDGEEIKTWPDQSTNEYDAVKVSGTAPTFRATGGANSKPCIECSSSANTAVQFLAADGASALFSGNVGNRTMFMVSAFTVLPSGVFGIPISLRSSSSEVSAWWPIQNQTGESILKSTRTNDAGTGVTNEAGTTDLAADTYNIISLTGGTGVTVRLEGTSEISYTIAGQATYNQFSIGGDVQSTNVSGGADIKICEIIVYNSVLSATDTNSVGEYLAEKYDLTWNTIAG